MVAPTLDWSDRIVGLTRESPDQLLAHPLNPKRHPASQRTALRAALDALGIIAPCTVNDRTGFLLDGHARVEEALSRGQTSLPVLHVDLSPEEESLALLTLDPIGQMFEAVRENTETLLADVQVDSAELVQFLAQQAKNLAIALPDGHPPPEPQVRSEHMIEIYCSTADLAAIQPTLDEWSTRPGVTVNVS